MDTTHLNALELRISHERIYLAQAKTAKERELRTAWIAQIEREIQGERKFLWIADPDEITLTDDELLAELMR